MIKFKVITEPESECEDTITGCRDFGINAEMVLSDEASVRSAFNMFIKALLLEGYHEASIVITAKEYVEQAKERGLLDSNQENF